MEVKLKWAYSKTRREQKDDRDRGSLCRCLRRELRCLEALDQQEAVQHGERLRLRGRVRHDRGLDRERQSPREEEEGRLLVGGAGQFQRARNGSRLRIAGVFCHVEFRARTKRSE